MYSNKHNLSKNVDNVNELLTKKIFNAKTTLGTQASSRDSDNYYEIDLNKLYNITLNYGGGSRENGDIYIVNEQSLEVYYLNGVDYEGITYYAKKK